MLVTHQPQNHLTFRPSSISTGVRISQHDSGPEAVTARGEKRRRDGWDAYRVYTMTQLGPARVILQQYPAEQSLLDLRELGTKLCDLTVSMWPLRRNYESRVSWSWIQRSSCPMELASNDRAGHCLEQTLRLKF
jgi:hypothetical protein